MKWTDFIGAALTAAAVGGLWLVAPEEGAATRRPRNAPQPVPGKPAADAPIDEAAAGWKLWRSPQQGLQMRYPPEWTITPAPSASSDGKSLRLPGLFVAGVQSPQPRKSDPFGGSLQVDLQLHEDVTTESEEITTWYLRNHRDPEEEKTGHGEGSSALLDAVDRVVSTLEVTGLPEQGRPAMDLHVIR